MATKENSYEIKVGDEVIGITTSELKVNTNLIDRENPLPEIGSFTTKGSFDIDNEYQIYRIKVNKAYLRNRSGGQIVIEKENLEQIFKDNDLKSGYKHGSWVTANFSTE